MDDALTSLSKGDSCAFVAMKFKQSIADRMTYSECGEEVKLCNEWYVAQAPEDLRHAVRPK